jgi:multiple sugar transport system substrate-binding protein
VKLALDPSRRDMHMRKLWLRTGVAAVAAIALAGAGTLTSTAASAASKTITISYWTHVNPPTNVFEKKLIAKFEKANPGIKVKYLPVEWGVLPTKIQTSIAAGGGPDLFNFFGSYAAGLMDKHYLAPVDLKAFGFKNGKKDLLAKFMPAVVNGFSSGNTVYGIPHEVTNFAFWINTDYFKAAGLDPVKDFPKTYDDVIRIGKQLQALSNGPKEGLVLPQYNAIREILTLQMMARQAGGSMFSADGKKAQLNSPGVIKALKMWGDLVNVDKINQPSLGPLASNYPEDLFGAGTAGMNNTGGSAVVSVLKDTYPKVNAAYTVGQQPTFTGGVQAGGTLYGFGLFVPVTSKHKAAAWKFASYLISQSQQYFDQTGVWLGDNATLKSAKTKTFPHWNAFSKNYAAGKFLPPLVHYSEIIDVVDRAVQRVVLQGESAATSLAKAQNEVAPLMK